MLLSKHILVSESFCENTSFRQYFDKHMDLYDPSALEEYLLPCFMFKTMFNLREKYCQRDDVNCKADSLLSDKVIMTIARRLP